MSTDGIIGFKLDDEMKVTYNHCDSYPEGLLFQIVDYIKKNSNVFMNNFNSIKMVNIRDYPSEEQVRKCSQYYDGTVSKKSKRDWYCLLRRAQGDLDAYVDCGCMIDYSRMFKKGSYDWAYIIDINKKSLIIYEYGEELLTMSINKIKRMNKNKIVKYVIGIYNKKYPEDE